MILARWIAAGVVAGGILVSSAVAAPRSAAHQEYAAALWKFLTAGKVPYTQWQQSDAPLEMPVGPIIGGPARTYLNRVAAGSEDRPYGSMVVTEHLSDDGAKVVGVSVWYRVKEGFDAKNADWYWAHFVGDGTAAVTSADKNPYARRGFFAQLDEDGRLWVFRLGTADLEEFIVSGEPARAVIRPGEGPGGITIKSSDGTTITDYLCARPGFIAFLDTDERLWVFREGSEEYTELKTTGDLAKRATLPATGPMGLTVKAPDVETAMEYIAAKPGFVTRYVDERIWVCRPDAAELAELDAGSEPAKQFVRPGIGPGGVTLKAPDAETIAAYLAAVDGFETILDKDGRVWVFRLGCPELEEFHQLGELVRIVIRPAAGPDGITVKGPDGETIDAYLRAAGVQQPAEESLE